jgi:hypothetical protein
LKMRPMPSHSKPNSKDFLMHSDFIKHDSFKHENKMAFFLLSNVCQTCL